MRLLLIEDNDELSALLVSGLSNENFSVDVARTVAEGMAALATPTFAAVILDLGLPDGDGLSILKAMRSKGFVTPVLVLTARGSVQDRVEGLQTGADDYLVKPFAFEELIARLRALLRRPSSFVGEALRLGRVTFDLASSEIQIDGEKQSHALARREAAILELLMRRSGRVVPKRLIEDHCYGLSEDGSANAVEVSVHRLRKQLAGANADLEIHTVRGVGYLIKELVA